MNNLIHVTFTTCTDISCRVNFRNGIVIWWGPITLFRDYITFTDHFCTWFPPSSPFCSLIFMLFSSFVLYRLFLSILLVVFPCLFYYCSFPKQLQSFLAPFLLRFHPPSKERIFPLGFHPTLCFPWKYFRVLQTSEELSHLMENLVTETWHFICVCLWVCYHSVNVLINLSLGIQYDERV